METLVKGSIEALLNEVPCQPQVVQASTILQTIPVPIFSVNCPFAEILAAERAVRVVSPVEHCPERDITPLQNLRSTDLLYAYDSSASQGLGITLKRADYVRQIDLSHASFYLTRIVVDEQECLRFESETYTQSSSPLWHSLRRERVSSSSAHPIRVCKGDKRERAKNLLYRKPFQSKATTYGLVSEDVARKEFEHLKGVKVTRTGLVVMLCQPWLCGSPDGIFWAEDETKLLEIKCPYSRWNSIIVDFEQKRCFVNYLCFRGSELKLKESSSYYTQVQILLYCTGLMKCVLYVFSRRQRDITIEILRDDKFLSEVVPSLEMFYFFYYLPLLYDEWEKSQG